MKLKLSISIPLVLTLLFSLCLNISAVDYQINFTTSGAGNTFDYVVVQNLTQNLSATVPSGSTLNLTDLTALPEFSSNEKLEIFPNPISGNAKIKFLSNQGGNTQINVFGIEGIVIRSDGADTSTICASNRHQVV